MANYISKEDRALAEVLLRRGLSLRRVADIVGIAKPTVQDLLYILNIRRGNGHRSPGMSYGRNQCSEWTIHRKQPLQREGKPAEAFKLAHARLIECRRILHYGKAKSSTSAE